MSRRNFADYQKLSLQAEQLARRFNCPEKRDIMLDIAARWRERANDDELMELERESA